jgi:hypothetical protein
VEAIGVETAVVSAEAATKAVEMQHVAALAVEADPVVAALAVEVVDLPVAGSAVDLLAAAEAVGLLAAGEAVGLLAALEATLTQVLSCPAWTPTATGSSTSANNRDRHSS